MDLEEEVSGEEQSGEDDLDYEIEQEDELWENS
jgi:hypothetical protein